MKSSQVAMAIVGALLFTFVELPLGYGAVSSTVLGGGSYQIGSTQYKYTLLKLKQPDQADAYVQYFPPTNPDRGVLIYTMPYDGVSWTGLAVDQAWTSKYPGGTPVMASDLNGPGYSPASSKPILYYTTPPSTGAALATPYLVNGMGVLLYYGRFYAGGSVGAMIQGGVSAVQYLIDLGISPKKIAIFGESLGGFQALYTAAFSAGTGAPIIGVAVSPLSDLERFVNHALVEIPSLALSQDRKQQLQSFYEPYIRRIYATTGGPPQAAPASYFWVSHSFLRSFLSSDFLIFHDEWDTLVPIADSQSLATALPSRISSLWYPEAGPLDLSLPRLGHELSSVPWKYWSEFSMTQSYIMTRLLPSNAGSIYVFYNFSAWNEFFLSMRMAQLSGRNLSSLVPRLIDLCDPRIVLLESGNSDIQPISGAAWVASFLKWYWGKDISAEQVGSFLKLNGLPQG